jgi:tetratricopeptide (TPR) repeat protein
MAINILKPQIMNNPQLYILLGKALIAEGIAYDQIGQLTNAIDDYIQSETTSKALNENGLHAMDDVLAKALSNCANDYKRIGQLSNSIVYYNHAQTVVMRLNTNTPEYNAILAKILKGRGAVFYAAGNITNAINDYTDCEQIISDKVEKEQCYIMIGLLLWIDNKTEMANVYFENGIKLNSDQKSTIFANQFLSEIQTNQDLSHLRKSLMETLQKSSQ